MQQSRALVFNEFGPPAEVLRLQQRPVAEPSAGEVKIRILASPIHPSDIGILLGKYGNLPHLPAVGGREGVAEVIKLGEGVEDLVVGDRVIVPGSVGTWQTLATIPVKGLFKVPSDIPVEMAAMCMVNPPTAWRMLRDSGLNKGEWVIQNAANSAVGLHVIEMAKHLDLKTINVVRREELIEPLKQMGADVVVLEDSGYHKRINELTGGEPVSLALNSIGGESGMRLVNVLSPNGIHITFGAMQFDPVRFPTRALIFNNVTMKGFWMDKWFRDNSEARVKIMFDHIFDLMRKGIVQPSVDRLYGLEDYKQAIERAGQPRMGKVLFRLTD